MDSYSCWFVSFHVCNYIRRGKNDIHGYWFAMLYTTSIVIICLLHVSSGLRLMSCYCLGTNKLKHDSLPLLFLVMDAVVNCVCNLRIWCWNIVVMNNAGQARPWNRFGAFLRDAFGGDPISCNVWLREALLHPYPIHFVHV